MTAYYFIQWIHVNPRYDEEPEMHESIVCGTSEEDAIRRFERGGHPLFNPNRTKHGNRKMQSHWYQVEGISKMPEEQRIALGYDL